MQNTRLYRNFVLLTTLLLAAGSSARQLPGQVLRIVDGDSLILQVGHAQYGIEIAGIDAPEPNQPWGGKAADRLRHTLVGAFVVVTSELSDGYWLTGRITYKDRDIGLDLIRDGLAWQTRVTQNALPEDHPYATAERLARHERRGLWSDPQPVAPWKWRESRGMR